MFFAALAATLLSTFAFAAGYPDHPVEFIVPSSAGGGTDVMTRNFAEAARKYIAPRPTATRSAC
jgi:tripartite-type tricarboxylate transporter receptor subunit TctC